MNDDDVAAMIRRPSRPRLPPDARFLARLHRIPGEYTQQHRRRDRHQRLTIAYPLWRPVLACCLALVAGVGIGMAGLDPVSADDGDLSDLAFGRTVGLFEEDWQ